MKVSISLKAILLAAVALGSASTLAAEENVDTVIVVPSTGHLAIKTSRNFFGPANVWGSSMNATAKSTEISYNTYPLDNIFPAGAYIITAAPGEYTLTFTDELNTAKFFSSATYWLDETPGVAYRKSRMLYKFVNNADSIGFVRDEAFAAEQYASCGLAADEHLYLPLNTTAVSNIATTLGTTQAELRFIPWTGPTPADIATGIEVIRTDAKAGAASATTAVRYNLLGQPVGADYKGLIIVGGKKQLVR